jgi:hypothetical protein
MMQTMDMWSPVCDHMQWGNFNDQVPVDYSNMWSPWNVDPSLMPYEHGIDAGDCFQDWTGYDGREDWVQLTPKFPPPHTPAPTVVVGSTAFEKLGPFQEPVQLATPNSDKDEQRPGALGLWSSEEHLLPRRPRASMCKHFELGQCRHGKSCKFAHGEDELDVAKAGEIYGVKGEDEDTLEPSSWFATEEALCAKADAEAVAAFCFGGHHTPSTSAPDTPASSLSEFEATPLAQTAPASSLEDLGNPFNKPGDMASGYSLFGSKPWHSLQLGAVDQQQNSDDMSAPAKASRVPPPPIGTGVASPVKVTLDKLLSGENVAQREADEKLTNVQTSLPPGILSLGSMAPPPGLGFDDSIMSAPPGLGFASVGAQEPPLRPPMPISREVSTVSASEGKALESIIVDQVDVNGSMCTRAVWRIVQLRGRLKTSLGKPVVSPPFSIDDLGGLRLMVTPDAKGTLEGLRGKSKQSHFAKMLSHGPLDCTLKVKVPCTSTPVVKFYLTVGSNCRQGPFTCDFSQHTMHGCNDFQCDWLKQVDDEDCLCVGLEIVEICANGQRSA